MSQALGVCLVPHTAMGGSEGNLSHHHLPPIPLSPNL